MQNVGGQTKSIVVISKVVYTALDVRQHTLQKTQAPIHTGKTLPRTQLLLVVYSHCQITLNIIYCPTILLLDLCP